MTKLRSKLIDILGSTLPGRRERLLQWLIASSIYLGAAIVLTTGVFQGWMNPSALMLWLAFMLTIVATGYAALRSGWTERFHDPSVTTWQLSMGVVLANWGYLICGPMRTATLFPIMVVFAFGAFSLRWRHIAFLTCLSLLCLVAVVWFRAFFPEWVPAETEISPVRMDVNNVLMLIVVLPPMGVLAGRLSSLRRKLRDQREALSKALSEVERLAVSDELTGIANRRSMRSILERSAAMSSREITPFCIAIMDIDHFKAVNDRLGHAGGDQVLKAFAHRANAQLRSTDAIGRWGGEEFVLMICGNLEGACSILERIRKSVRDCAPDARPVTFSAGVAQHLPDETPDELLARADAALYKAKRTGRDRYVVAESSCFGRDSCEESPSAAH